MADTNPTGTDEFDKFWAQVRSDEEAARGRQADPSACGTCTSRVGDGQPVEHDECAARALLLKAPDQPSWEVLIEMTDEEKAALPARFHTPVWEGDAEPNAWLCAVCWGEGSVSSWPCATAVKRGREVFTPDHEAERQQKQTAKALEEARAAAARLAELEAIVVNARKLISGWRQSHAEHLQVSLVPTLKANPFMAGQQMGRSNQYGDCAEELADVLLGEDPDDWEHGVGVEIEAAPEAGA